MARLSLCERDRVGAAVATGDGEEIMRSCLRCVCVRERMIKGGGRSFIE